MPDPANTANAPATGEAPDNKPNGAGADPSTQGPKESETPRVHTPEEVSRIVARELAKERKKWEAEAERIKADATKTQEEKLQSEIESLRAEKRERDLRDGVLGALDDPKVGARNTRAIYRLIKDDLDVDKDGKISNLKELISEAKANYPELFTTTKGSVDAGARGNGAQIVDMNSLIRHAAGR